jgi:glycerol-3-phosphate dehydrogenase (NAD(P)+)
MALALQPYIPAHVPLVLCAKGILFDASRGESTFPAQVLASILPNPVALLSGPNFAADVAKGLPTATTLACVDATLACNLGEALRSPHLRVYLTQDVTGVQIAGALKNPLAIACGLAHSLGLGENAKAALITRGLAEIRRLGMVLGGQLETFLGLAGVGDLVLTCSSTQSRNFRFGVALGQAEPIERAMESVGGVVEGFYTTQAAYYVAAQHNVHMPITQCLYHILYDQAPLSSAIEGLMQQLSAWESD